MGQAIFGVLSGVFFLAGVLLYGKNSKQKIDLLLCFFIAVVSILLFSLYGVSNYLTGNGIDEATIYHLKYGVGGAGFKEYISIALWAFSFLSLVVFILAKISLKAARNNCEIKGRVARNRIAPVMCLSGSLLLNPASSDIYKLEVEPLEPEVVAEETLLEEFHEYYKAPHIDLETPEKSTKNFVFIYAESLERTYFDEAIFPGLIKGLKEVESGSTTFTNIKQIPGTGWTIGGMTASQCGIPLFTPADGSSMSGMDNFLGSAVCLGDLLTNEGYHLAYYGGASLDFAGKGKLYKTHGFSEIKGRDELTPMLEDKDYSSGWGLYDDSLLGLVYDKFLTLSEEGRRFGLVTLTLDTHHPNGHPSKSCDGVKYQQGDNPILNAVACSDYLITKFVNKVIESKYAKDTVIILASDHLAKRNTAHDILKKNEQKRRNVFMVIDPAQVNYKEVKTEGSTLDVGVNILPFIGYRGSLGLGRKLTDNEQEVVNEKTLIHKNLTRWKRFIQGFWGLDKARNELTNYTNKSDGQEI